MKVAVIGGGAAGFFAAIHAAENNCNVTILERSDKLLTKVKVSGGGRCNVTNACEDLSLFVRNYPRGNRELRGPFTKFNREDTIRWFADKGVALKAEPDGRMFPVTNSSQTIVDVLLETAKKHHVKIITGSKVEQITKSDSDFLLKLNGNEMRFDRVIIAAGGNRSAEFYKFITELGHAINPPVPSLFTFNVPDNNYTELMGVSVQEVTISICNSSYEETGPLLFTHWGLSGPAVLKLSAWAARLLNELNYLFEINIDFLPDLSHNELADHFKNLRSNSGSKKVIKSRIFDLPNRLWLKVCELSDLKSDLMWSDCSNSSINELSDRLKNARIKVNGKTTFREEFVTCGGVNLKEVNMKSMESKLVSGLFFAGEVLDIDGITGGFNFQAAWTTGYLAGTSCCI